MFNEEIYGKMKTNPLFKKFILYCVIGCVCFFVMGAVLTVSAAVFFSGILRIAAVISGSACLIVPVSFVINGIKKPFLCSEGVIRSKSEKSAVVTVGETDVRGTSFEHFLRNVNLDGYAPGDTVIIYASDKKMSRPLFFRV